MTQTAAAYTLEEEYLQIASQETTTISNNEALLSVEDRDAFLENHLFKNVSAFYYRDNVRLAFVLSQEFRPHFVLIRGLIEFSRAKQFSFNYDRKHRTIETDIRASQIEDLQLFFGKIIKWVNREIQFKTALKMVLDFEHRYRTEQDGVYTLLMRSAVAN